MKKLAIGPLLLACAAIAPLPAIAQVPGPPPIYWATPPDMIVIPETYVYAVPDVPEEIYFYNGWWWRLWNGRWYRSPDYARGWVYYGYVPEFYVAIPRGWRTDFRGHRWHGHAWNYERIPVNQVQRNWASWENTRHWENQRTWGVSGLTPRSSWREGPGRPNPQGHPQNTAPGRPQGYAGAPQGQPAPQGGQPGMRPQGQGQPMPQGGQPGMRPQGQGQPMPQAGQPGMHPQGQGQPMPQGGQPGMRPQGQGQPVPQGAGSQTGHPQGGGQQVHPQGAGGVPPGHPPGGQGHPPAEGQPPGQPPPGATQR